jgi:hypothetical protein
MTFVDSLSDKAKAELLDLILKSRGESGPEVDIFETGEARIRVEDYERLDTNRDGLISKYMSLLRPLLSLLTGTVTCTDLREKECD